MPVIQSTHQENVAFHSFSDSPTIKDDAGAAQKKVGSNGSAQGGQATLLEPRSMQEVLQHANATVSSAHETPLAPQTLAANNTESQLLGKDRIGDSDALNTSLMVHECTKNDNDSSVQQENGYHVKSIVVTDDVRQAFDLVDSKEAQTTLAGAEKALHAVEQAIANLSDKDSALTPVLEKLADVAGALVKSHKTVVGALKEKIQGLQTLHPKQQLEGFKHISSLWGQLDKMEAATATQLSDSSSPDELELAGKILNGKELLPGGGKVCKDMLVDCGVNVLRNLLPDNKKDVITDDLLRMAIMISFDSGMDPLTMLHELERATDENLLSSELIGAILQETANPTTSLPDKLAFIDNMFIASYPHAAPMALILKLALTPSDKKNIVVAQHNYVLSWNDLTNNVFVNPSGSKFYTQPSFMLTPDWVKASCTLDQLKKHEYHIAHVVYLQKTLIENGFFGEIPKETIDKFSDLAAWGRLLDNEQYIKTKLADVDSPEDKANNIAYFNEAVARFNKGLEGDMDVYQANVAITRSAVKKPWFGKDTTADKLYSLHPSYLAHKHLDNSIKHLTGFYDPDKRLLVDEHKETNGAMIDEAIKNNMKNNPAAQPFDLNNPAVQAYAEASKEKTSSQKQLNALNSQHNEKKALIQDMAANKKEAARLMSDRKNLDQEYETHKKNWKGLSWPWLHTYKSRLPICITVKEICGLDAQVKQKTATMKNLDKNSDATSIASLQKEIKFLNAEIEKRKKTLKGVDSNTMAYSAMTDSEFTTETIVKLLGPKADAVIYYCSGMAKEIHKKRAVIAKKMDAHFDKQIEAADKLEKLYGKSNVKDAKIVFRAAILKTFVESGVDANKFNIIDKKNMGTIREQIKKWGLNIDNPYFEDAFMGEVYLLTHGKSGLDIEALKSLETPTASAVMITAGRNENVDLDDVNARREVALQKYGVKALVESASVPGGGFNYSRSGGVTIGTPKPPKVKTEDAIIPIPFSAQFGWVDKNSIAVRNTGKGYAVAVRSDDIFSLSASVGLKEQYSQSSISLKGKLQGTTGGGLYIHFPDAESCEAFVHSYMHGASQPTTQDGSTAKPAWLAGSDIRFFNENEVSGSIGAGLEVGNYSLKLENSYAQASAGIKLLTVKADIGAGWKEGVEYNTHSSSTTVSKDLSFSISASALEFSAKVTLQTDDDNPLTATSTGASKSKAALSTSATVTINHAGNVDVDRDGMLLPTTGMKTSTRKESDPSLNQTLLSLSVPVADIKKLIKSDKYNDMDYHWNAASDSSLVTVKWQIRPEKYAEALNLQTQIKAHPEASSTAKLKSEYNAILGDMASYEPQSLSFFTKKNTEVDYSPTFTIGIVSYDSSNTHTSFKEKSFSLAGVA